MREGAIEVEGKSDEVVFYVICILDKKRVASEDKLIRSKKSSSMKESFI